MFVTELAELKGDVCAPAPRSSHVMTLMATAIRSRSRPCRHFQQCDVVARVCSSSSRARRSGRVSAADVVTGPSVGLSPVPP
jgi:hypothetical protein